MNILTVRKTEENEDKDDSKDDEPRSFCWNEDFSRNENVFMHSILIFKLTFHVYLKRNSSHFKRKYDNYIELISDVCNLPTFDYKRRDKLLREVDRRFKRYSQSLLISVLNTDGIEDIASSQRGDRVFLRFIAPNVNKNIELHQTANNSKWMPFRGLISKYYDYLIIHLISQDIEENTEFRIEIVLSRIKTIKDALLDTIGVVPNSTILGIHTQTFGSLDPQDEEVSFSFKYENHLVKIYLKLQWVLRVSLLKGGYFHFTRIRAFHREMIEQFLRWKWRTGKDLSKCVGNTKNMAALVPQSSIPKSLRQKNECWKHPYKLSDVAKVINLLSESKLMTFFNNPELFCVCNEWCNIHSFYFHNPIARFVLCQNQKMFVVPQNLIVPYHFLSVANIISRKNIHCIGLFSSCIQMLKEYINAINADDTSTLRNYFWDTCAGTIIRKAYHNIRQWLVKPESFKIVKLPFDDYSYDFICFVKEILWLSSHEQMKDPKLSKKLRYKFQDILVYWVDFVLERPSLHIIPRLMVFDYFINPNNYPVTVSQKSTSSGKVFLIKSLILIVKERDKRGETREQLMKSIEKITDSRSSVIVECSSTLSLIHKMYNFIASADSLIPFYAYDKQLYRSESEMAREIDSTMAKKVQRNHIKIVIIRSAEEDESRDVIFTHYYIVILYSVALAIQTFIVQHIAYTFHAEFSFDYPLEEICFFTSNDWIESITELSLGDKSSKRIFMATDEIREIVDEKFDQFYKEYWVPFSNEPEKVEMKFVYDCACFVHWFKSVKDNENDPFMSVEREFIKIVSQCFSNAEQYLEMNVASIDTDSMKDVNINKCKRLQTKYTVKAFFYNIVSITAIIAQKCLTFLKNNEIESFVGIIPVWIKLLNLYVIIKQNVQMFTSKHCDSEDKEIISNLLPTVLQHINSIFCLVYVHLMNVYISYISRLQNQKQLLKLLFMIISPMLNRFKNNFTSVHKYVYEKVHTSLAQTRRSTETQVTQFIRKCKYLQFESSVWQETFVQQLNRVKSDFQICISTAFQWDIQNQRDF